MAELLMVNPKKRRAKRKTSVKRRRRNPTHPLMTNPVKRRRRSMASRTGGISAKNITGQITDAAIMAGGGVITDLLTAKMPFIPADMKTGNLAPLTRAGVAIGLGLTIDKVLKQKKIGRDVTQGALVVIAHDFITKTFGQRIGLSAYEEMNAYEDLGDYSDLLLETDIAGMGDNDLLGNDSLLGMGANDFDDIVAMSAYSDMGEYENAGTIAQYDEFDDEM